MSSSLLRSRNTVKIVSKTHSFSYASSSSIANGSFARRVSSGSGKHTLVSFQSFSAVASEEGRDVSVKQDSNTPPSQPRALPTRHSRHHAPPVAPVNVLDVEHDKIVSSIPGTLIAFNPQNLHQTKKEEYEHALLESFQLSQHIEYILRGYSAQISPSSIVHLQAKKKPIETKKVSNQDDVYQVINKMIKLVERIEEEGNVYVELRSKYRVQLAQTSSQTATIEGEQEGVDSSSNINTDSSTNAWKISQLIKSYGAAPGPTITMYDLILDAIAISMPHCKDGAQELSLLEKSRDIYVRALERFELDQKAEMTELNAASCPTTMTFNAMIRAAANTKNSKKDERVRDVAMENAFFAFNAMHHHPVVPRNSATYAYMLQMMNAHFPVGEMRGHIAVGMWEKCLQDGVVDENVIQSMMEFGDNKSHGEMFDGWFLKSIKSVWNPKERNGFGFPVSWGEHRRLRRFDKRLDVY